MKLTLTQQEAETILARELKDYLGLADVPEDFEVEILTHLTATECEQRLDYAKGQWPNSKALDQALDAAKQLAEPDTWQPDGTTPPPSRDAFLAWAKGRKVCIRWNPTTPLTVDSIDDKWANFLCANGSKKIYAWKLADWQEYTDAN